MLLVINTLNLGLFIAGVTGHSSREEEHAQTNTNTSVSSVYVTQSPAPARLVNLTTYFKLSSPIFRWLNKKCGDKFDNDVFDHS